MTENQTGEMLTTAQAAKVLDVRSDTVHAMKGEGKLKVVGKGSHGANLFAAADVQALKTERDRGRLRVPEQTQLPTSAEPSCTNCRVLLARVRAAEKRAVAAEGRARRTQAAMNAALAED